MNKHINPVACTVRTTSAKHLDNGTRMAGFFYIEVLVAVALIALALVPAMDALIPGIAGSAIHEARAEDHYQLTGKLEQVLAEPVANLDIAAAAAGNPATPTSYSDDVATSAGRRIKRNVFLSRYDGDNADADNNPFTGTDEGLLWVRVTIAGSGAVIESLVSDNE